MLPFASSYPLVLTLIWPNENAVESGARPSRSHLRFPQRGAQWRNAIHNIHLLKARKGQTKDAYHYTDSGCQRLHF